MDLTLGILVALWVVASIAAALCRTAKTARHPGDGPRNDSDKDRGA